MSAGSISRLPKDIFQTIFEKSPGSLLVAADPPCFTIIAASDTYLAITSSERDAIVGKSFFESFPDDESFEDENSARKVFTRVIGTRQKIDVPNYRFDVLNPETKQREAHYWSCCNTPIFDDNNDVAYVLNTVVDISEEVRATEAAIENENRLRLAADAAALGTWELNLKDMNFIYSPRLVEIFGYPAEVAIALNDIREQVNADDMQNIVIKSYHEALINGKYLYEVRIYWPDGSLHWIKVQGIVVNNEKKAPIVMLGTVLDITESKSDEIRKNDFIAMASHELKTPLTSLKAYIQLLSKKLDHANDSFISTALSKANYQVNKMTDLIHGFLDLSRLEPGKLKLKVQFFEMNKLIRDIVAESVATNPTHVIEFQSQDMITVAADREKIGQVVSNFLSNAAKYSERGSKITITSRKIDGNIEVKVTDEGIGIKPKHQERLFQRFYRVENEKMKNVSGFGIGLYLSSEIIQRHSGKIGVESAEDKGSTFYFSLPLPS